MPPCNSRQLHFQIDFLEKINSDFAFNLVENEVQQFHKASAERALCTQAHALQWRVLGLVLNSASPSPHSPVLTSYTGFPITNKHPNEAYQILWQWKLPTGWIPTAPVLSLQVQEVLISKLRVATSLLSKAIRHTLYKESYEAHIPASKG